MLFKIVSSFRLTRTEEILLDGEVSACGLRLVLFGLFLGCLCPFLHHLIVVLDQDTFFLDFPAWRTGSQHQLVPQDFVWQEW